MFEASLWGAIMYRRGLGSILGGVLGAAMTVVVEGRGKGDTSPQHIPFSRGGYSNRAHSWDGSRKVKGYMRGQQPRRSKAQRRARAG